jgi:glycosyltransferase involved in cell wall biosynthesis
MTLAKALSDLIESSAMRKKMGEMSRKKFLNEFNITKMIESVHDLYDRTVSS